MKYNGRFRNDAERCALSQDLSLLACLFNLHSFCLFFLFLFFYITNFILQLKLRNSE